MFWISSLSEACPRRALNQKDFFQFSGLTVTSLCFLGVDLKFNVKKNKSMNPKIGFAGNMEKQQAGKK